MFDTFPTRTSGTSLFDELSVEQKAIAVELFVHAKSTITTDPGYHIGQSPYICDNLSYKRAMFDNDEQRRVVSKQLYREIADRIGHRFSVKEWLSERGMHWSFDEVQQYRIQWIDQMIEELSA